MKTPAGAALFLLVAAAGCHGTFRDLPERGGSVGTSRVEPRLSRVGSSLVRKEIEVRCWSRRDWREQIEDREADAEHEFAGMASEGGPVDLAPDACAPLVGIMYTRARPATRKQEVVLAYAVGVLAHELEHVRGELDEERAECFGIQRLAGVARELGLSADYAQRLARIYWTDVYLGSQRDYRTPDCRNGRKLDLRRESELWP